MPALPQDPAQWLVAAMIANAVLVLPMALLVRRDFVRLGRVSWPMAIWTGAAMHGHALASFALAFVDRGGLYTPGPLSLTGGTGVFLLGAFVIYLGRGAYGDQARVYGLKEDVLIEHGIYRRSRNPQYLGYGLMFLGAALAGGSGLALVFTLVFAGLVHLYIRYVEEPHLTRIFGGAYTEYCQRVGRYFRV